MFHETIVTVDSTSIHGFKCVPIVLPLSRVSQGENDSLAASDLRCLCWPPHLRDSAEQDRIKLPLSSNMSLLLTDVSGTDDPRCTVGSKARRRSLPRLLMALLASIPYRALYFSLLFWDCLPSITWFLVFVQHATKMCSNWRYRVDPCCPLCCLQFLTITLGLSPDKLNGPACLWLCAVLTDRWASQLIPSLVFVELWNDCCWWTRPSAAFLVARSRLRSAWGRLVDLRLFKVIIVTVHKINMQLLLPLLPLFTTSERQRANFSCMS